MSLLEPRQGSIDPWLIVHDYRREISAALYALSKVVQAVVFTIISIQKRRGKDIVVSYLRAHACRAGSSPGYHSTLHQVPF